MSRDKRITENVDVKETHVISLGAGVQSTTMLLMACHGEITPKPDLVVFADTGWEPRPVYDHLEWLKGEVARFGIEIKTVSSGNIREDLLKAAKYGSRVASLPFFIRNQDGTTGMIMRQCTSEYKIQAVRKAILEHLGVTTFRGYKGRVFIWMGISIDEIERVRQTSGTPENRYPLIEKMMNRLDCMNWLTRHGYGVPPKSSCIGCPFHDDRMWLEMKRNDPEAWADAVYVDHAIRKLPRINGEVYLHRSCVPLDQVDLNENQMDLFDDGFLQECQGYCGV